MEKEFLVAQYELVRGSRKVLLDYCETLSAADLLRNLNTFGSRSIRYLLVHVVNTYYNWLEQFGMAKEPRVFKEELYNSVSEIRDLYQHTDEMVLNFLDHFEYRLHTSITRALPQQREALALAPYILFTHVITHEFHHKGQILSMSRQLGYIPIDTDVIRFT